MNNNLTDKQQQDLKMLGPLMEHVGAAGVKIVQPQQKTLKSIASRGHAKSVQSMKRRHEAVRKLRNDLRKTTVDNQEEGTDLYALGMYNGLETAYSLLFSTKPEFLIPTKREGGKDHASTPEPQSEVSTPEDPGEQGNEAENTEP